ncbi:MAG: 16S rRNA (cytosine(1402)-N(4))-methyltransferase RsmH [Clostridiales bacterium]|nr:16S rRNA (cytosine(1402)-N(4))-methyltransferase RsmH [Candidatus Equinaster intestinalis]
MEFIHKPVLFEETIASLNIKPDGIYLDGTVGGAGHSRAIAEKLQGGQLVCLDRDPDAVKVATERLAGFNARVIRSNFKDMNKVLESLGIEKVDGILLDLGVSSFQLDNAERGFSYHKEAPLDMRMSKSGLSAEDIVNGFSADEIADILFRFGEEKFAYRIARKIISEREKAPIKTTTQLADIISGAVPAAARRDGHPARKTFQALRIAVNGELDSLATALDTAFELLKPGGVLSIITFHSLEDRMVKQKFKEFCTGCTCPPDIPVCVCGKKPRGRLYNKKPIQASENELKDNARSRSANLRAIIKI